MSKYNDLTGKVFGQWTVLYKSDIRKANKIYWHCRCSCGNEKDVQGAHLTQGKSKSCGCLRRKITSERSLIDLTGQRFGHWTVLKQAEKHNTDTHVFWVCQCDCGNIKEVNGKSLRIGASKSCGCVKSYGEQKIASILSQYQIPFVQEKDFENCRYEDSNFKAKFDFYVDNKYIIEYDGKQHFGIGGWNDQKNFIICKNHDNYKNNWCKKNNIPLIRIPYTTYDNITIEDLKLETSKWIII